MSRSLSGYQNRVVQSFSSTYQSRTFRFHLLCSTVGRQVHRAESARGFLDFVENRQNVDFSAAGTFYTERERIGNLFICTHLLKGEILLYQKEVSWQWLWSWQIGPRGLPCWPMRRWDNRTLKALGGLHIRPWER